MKRGCETNDNLASVRISLGQGTRSTNIIFLILIDPADKSSPTDTQILYL